MTVDLFRKAFQSCVAICVVEYAWLTLTFEVCFVTALSSQKAALRILEGKLAYTEKLSQVIISIQLSCPQSVFGVALRRKNDSADYATRVFVIQ